ASLAPRRTTLGRRRARLRDVILLLDLVRPRVPPLDWVPRSCVDRQCEEIRTTGVPRGGEVVSTARHLVEIELGEEQALFVVERSGEHLAEWVNDHAAASADDGVCGAIGQKLISPGRASIADDRSESDATGVAAKQSLRKHHEFGALGWRFASDARH